MGTLCFTDNKWLVLCMLSKPAVTDIMDINATGVHLANS